MKPGSKVLAIALLFVGLVLVNYLASALPVRFDATAEQIYTLSPGTRALLGKIEEPITLDYYFSRSAAGLPISYKNYAERVDEMLRQYVKAARGKLTLNVIDPRPDTPEEERATAAGLEPQQLPTGDQIQFGLVATQADQQKTITALTPEREQFLEYDLSQLIYSVEQFDKKKLGLITSLPLQAGQPDMQMMMSGQRPPPGQYVTAEWERTFQIVPVDAAATELPSGLDALAVIHPENLSPKLQFAIDQFLLGGRPVFLAVDPSSAYFKRQGGQQAMMMGGPPPNVSSDLPALLGAYGIAYDPQKVVGDLETAASVRNGTDVTRYPVWLNLQKENFNAKSLPTAQLNSALFVEPGSLALKAGSNLSFTPLIESSAQAGDVPAMALQFAQPDAVARQITPSGKKTIAALVTGKFKSAFPDGAPRDEPPADPTKKDDPAAPKKDDAKAAPALKESSGTSTLLIVADTDWLFDDYSVRKINFFGQVAAEPLNDNLSFASNSLEFLSGSQDLISIRGKGSSLHPFKVVQAMEVEANKKYEEKLNALESRLTQVQTHLSELQGKKGEGGRLVASPEVAKAIEDFQKQQAEMRGERRDIRRALREDIDALGNRLLVVNLLATPVLVCCFGLWFYRRRRQ
ncbi:MAG TPA: GldG family protein [Opitutaceae bacterium]|nr:GldG family protein [Opitutaceae bacterium]